MQILKEKIVRYETDGSIVKGYDAGELIRCKDCKYFTRDTITGVTIPGSEYCIFTMNNRIEEDDFCSRAERKEE